MAAAKSSVAGETIEKHLLIVRTGSGKSMAA
jgi:hypothetical protein